MSTKVNTPLSAKKFVAIVVGGFFLLCVVIAAVSPSKSTSPQPTSSAALAVTTTSPAATPAVQSDGTTNACHGVASAACDEQIAREASTAAAAKATVNPIWLAESTTACDHEDAATGTLSASCTAVMAEVCSTPIDEASTEIVSDEETLKTNACRMEALGNVQH